MSYTSKNGILYKDGKPKFLLGTSYYPSFHPAKYPVPPEEDRKGEMEKDLTEMKKYGFNNVRIAALADVNVDKDDNITVTSDFIDSIAEFAEAVDMSVGIRLHGYVMNIRRNTDYRMINNKGEVMEAYWSAFLHSTFFHKGILKDNKDMTIALAKHYEKFASVISYQIYNEPHYPYNGVFDYHPLAIEAYRAWLINKNILTKKEAETYYPPKERAKTEKEIEEWILWRQFAMESHSDFLNNTAEYAKDTTPEFDMFTCLTNSVSCSTNGNMGVSYFQIAEKMDYLGITLYTSFNGADYFAARHTLDMAESAAALFGKHASVVELDARTKMPCEKFYRSTYSTIGAGHKGINYYEWRGDYPDKDSPFADNCGLIHYDGTKTNDFEKKMKLIALIDKLSEKIVTTEKKRTHIAVLCSDHGYLYFDAFTDSDIGAINIWQYITVTISSKLIKKGYNIDYVRVCDLKENKLDIDTLYIPLRDALSKEECSEINQFVDRGNLVFAGSTEGTFSSLTPIGFRKWQEPHKDFTTSEFNGNIEIEDTFDALHHTPFVEVADRNLFASVLEGANYYIVTLTCNNTNGEMVAPQKIRINLNFNNALFINTEIEEELEINNHCVKIPEFTDGAFIILGK